MTRAIIIAAPSSGAGKTTLTLAILAALKVRGIAVRAAKIGPDYIDPAFHAVATGHPSVNLDPWAMTADTLRSLAFSAGGELLVVEAAMGVLDAGANGQGSAADLAAALGVPVVIVQDIAKTGQSAGLAASGLEVHRPDISVAGVILNRAGSERHVRIARSGLRHRCFGALPRSEHLTLPERHLGLVQASETQGLEEYLMRAAQMAEDTLDLDGLINAALPLKGPGNAALHLPPLGQRIAVADDTAFAFAYPHLLAHWREQGAEILTFSPLADEAPDENTDAIFLPGGYPELHAGHLAQAMNFKAGMRAAAARSATIYGECGGYMALGAGLVDAKGQTHEMLDLLPVSTSFQNRRLTLGYRNLTASSGPFKGDMLGHEFHYATITEVGEGPRLFTARDAEGNDLGAIGHVRNNVSGSFAHLIAPKGA